jgi:DHA1 family bicyclomycin/chloramphenicol resistance-like MFS transporter
MPHTGLRGLSDPISGEEELPNAVGVQPSRQFFYGTAIALFVYGWLSVNIYLPILPKLESIFQTTPQMARLTVTVFLIGFSLSQLVWGPLSDRFGRRPTLLIGIAISGTGAALTGLTTDIYLFVGARFLESLGLGVAPALARSVLTDSLDRAHVAIAMAYAVIALALVPAIAPIVGGYLDLLMSWRSIFFFLALYGAALIVWCVFCLPETNKNKDPSLRASKVAVGYLEMLHNRRYSGYIISYGIAYGSLIGYYAAAPYIFINVLGYSSHEYGYLLIFNVAFYMLGASVARVSVPRLGTDRTIAFAIMAFASASIVFVAMDRYTAINTVSVLLPMSIFLFGSGLVGPAANAGAMTIFRDRAGASTAIVGFSPVIGGAIFSAGLSAVYITRLWELGTYVAISALISIANYWVLLRERTGHAAG